MSTESIVCLLLGFPLAFYGSVVYGRMNHFAEIKREILRIVRTVDFMQEDNGIVVANDQEISKLSLVASELFSLNHKKAGEEVLRICSDFHEISEHAKIGRLKVSSFEKNYADWQSTANELPPNKVAFWNPL